jgi:Ca2+-binding RTX toxin-like protein
MAVTIPRAGGFTILGDGSSETIIGTAQNDIILGFAGNDTISGGIGNDSIDGGADNDSLVGGSGNDTLIGNIGNDTLLGANINSFNDTGERDVLIGGVGSDRFVLSTSNEGALIYYFDFAPGTIDGFATILDFQAGTDNILLGNVSLSFRSAVSGGNNVIFRDLNANQTYESGVDDTIAFVNGNSLPVGAINTGAVVNPPFVGLISFLT